MMNRSRPMNGVSGACFRYMINRNRDMRSMFKIYSVERQAP